MASFLSQFSKIKLERILFKTVSPLTRDITKLNCINIRALAVCTNEKPTLNLNYPPIYHVEISRNIFASSCWLNHSKHSIQCWKCGSEVDEETIVFCGKCKVVQRPKSDANYFDLLGMRQEFDLKTQDLTTQFRKLQMQLHPDRFTQKQEEEQSVSAEYSSLLNRAYRTLLSPLERGLYLLELEGFPLLEGEVDLGQEFYFEIMELNEELAEAENEADIDRFEQKNQSQLDSLLRSLSEAFKQRDFVRARLVLAKLKYFVNIQEKIKAIQQEKGIVKD